MSKCAGCDEHNATIHADHDMYCENCYREKLNLENELDESLKEWIGDLR